MFDPWVTRRGGDVPSSQVPSNAAAISHIFFTSGSGAWPLVIYHMMDEAGNIMDSREIFQSCLISGGPESPLLAMFRPSRGNHPQFC